MHTKKLTALLVTLSLSALAGADASACGMAPMEYRVARPITVEVGQPIVAVEAPQVVENLEDLLADIDNADEETAPGEQEVQLTRNGKPSV